MEKGLKQFDKYIKSKITPEDLIGSSTLIKEEDLKDDTQIEE